MFGKGLASGLGVTWKHLWGKKETFSYPEVKLPMTARFRGGHLALDTAKCICCRLCATSCPNGALTLTPVMGEDKKRHMEKYVHDIGRCIYCGFCVDACPVKAIHWDQDYELASYFKEDMTYDAVQEEAARNENGNGAERGEQHG